MYSHTQLLHSDTEKSNPQWPFVFTNMHTTSCTHTPCTHTPSTHTPSTPHHAHTHHAHTHHAHTHQAHTHHAHTHQAHTHQAHTPSTHTPCTHTPCTQTTSLCLSKLGSPHLHYVASRKVGSASCRIAKSTQIAISTTSSS